MDESHHSPGDVQRRSDSRPGSYLSEIHIEMVTLLVVVFVVLLAVGFSLRPASSGYPSVPHGLALTVDADPLSALP
jgi:lipopolysaccharide export LptBFGC system permease protein LptF